MKLLTHNMLMCNRKGCTIEHFPMKIEPTKLAVHESEFNPDFILNVLPKIDWNALVSGAKDVKTNRTHACASTLRVIQLTALLLLLFFSVVKPFLPSLQQQKTLPTRATSSQSTTSSLM